MSRNLSKKKKGSNHRKEAKRKLAKLHIKIANQRKDYFHKLSNDLTQRYDTVFIEDLNMKAMQMMWGKKVSDLAFSEFVNILSYKTKVKKIDRFYLWGVCQSFFHHPLFLNFGEKKKLRRICIVFKYYVIFLIYFALYQYKNPNNQRGTLPPNPISISSATTKELGFHVLYLCIALHLQNRMDRHPPL